MLLPQVLLHSSVALSSEAYTLDLNTWHVHMCSMCTCGACQQGLASLPSNCSTTNQPIVFSFTVQGSGFKAYCLNDIQDYPLVTYNPDIAITECKSYWWKTSCKNYSSLGSLCGATCLPPAMGLDVLQEKGTSKLWGLSKVSGSGKITFLITYILSLLEDFH